MILVAGPVSHDFVSSNTGLYEKEVMYLKIIIQNLIIYSVNAPIINPPHNPTNVQSHASTGDLLSHTNYYVYASLCGYVKNYKSSGREMAAARYKTGVKIMVEIIS